MIYVILTYLFSPLIYMLIAFRKSAGIKKILVIQTAKIGDLICSTPVFREVKKKYPDAHLKAMVNPVTKELLEYNPNVNEIIIIKEADYRGLSGKLKLSRLMRKGNYDVAICLNPNVPFAIATFWGLIPIRLSVMSDFSGITFRLASKFFTHLEKHVKGRLVIETYMQMLKVIGVESNNISKEVYKSTNADIKVQQVLGSINKPLVGIAVSSGNKLKEMEPGKIAELINMLLDNMDLYVALIGSVQDKNKSEEVLNSVNKKERILNVSGELTLSELPSILERLSLLIGVDTGIAYMADALSIPVIDISGPSDMNDQRPTGENSVIIQNKLPCVPCSHAFKSPYDCRTKTRECIMAVSPKEIFNAVKILLVQARS